MDGSVSGAAAASPEGQEQIADAVQQTTGFSPASEPADAPHPALREDQIQNAVAFLAHPKVRSSPVDSKRSFLEKKGLTEREIAEAFKRVPDTPSDSAPAGPSGLPANPSAPPPKPYPTATAETLQQLVPAPLKQSQPIRWTQVVIGVGLLAAVSYAVKQYVAPKVSQWYHEWRNDADKAKAEEEQQKTAQLVASAIQSQTAEMQKTLESLKDALTTLEKGKAPAEVPRDSITLTDLRSELRVLASSLNEFSSPAKAASGEGEGEKLEEIRALMSTMVQQIQELPEAIKPVAAPSASYGAGAADNQHGQSAFAPHAAHALPNGEPLEPSALTNGDTPSQPPHPASYMEVLEMLEKGETPPNIRTDIMDEPPNPAAVPSSARMKPRAKPWERSGPPASSEPFPAFASGGSGGLAAGSAFPPASRAALSPRGAPVEGVGESTSAPMNQGSSGLAQVTELPPGAPHDAGSSSSSPAPAWRPPAVPQPSLPRPADPPAESSAASSTAGAPSLQPAEKKGGDEPAQVPSSRDEAAAAEAEAGGST